MRAEAMPQIGDKMPDGTILAGYHEGKALYTTPADAPLTYTFNRAVKYAEKLDAHGHQDWRVPSKSELNVLFQNHAAIEGFDTSGPGLKQWYRSSTEDLADYTWGQRFSDGDCDWSVMGRYELSLRVVR